MINYLTWALVVVLYSPIFIKLYRVSWESLDYTHAYFILPISLFLTWRNRDKIRYLLQTTKPNGSLSGLFILLLGILMFIFGWRQVYLLISTLSLIPLIAGLIIYLYGIEMIKILWFPISYLFLLVPPPMAILDSVTLPMRHAISAATEIILSFFTYPIKREGLLLTIGYNDIFMGQPCSGFRSLITLLSLGIVYVYLSKSSSYKKILLSISILPLALLGNLIRVIVLCLITYYFGEAAGQGFFHNFSGIVMFIITIIGLIGLETALNKTVIIK